MCGGTLSVNSKPGEGTTIYIRVPEDEVKII
jgi:signal transduction histidine kinase